MPMPKTHKAFMATVEAHLDQTSIEDDPELSQSAFEAGQALEVIREFFVGTPIEEILSQAITVCGIVADRAGDT